MLRWTVVLCVCLVARLVGISLCQFHIILFIFLTGNANSDTSATPYRNFILFPIWVFEMVITVVALSARGVWGGVCYCTIQLNAFSTSGPSVKQRERERQWEKDCLRALHAFWSYRHAPSYMSSLWKVTQIHVADCNNWMKASQRQKKTRPLMSDCENGNKKRRESALHVESCINFTNQTPVSN